MKLPRWSNKKKTIHWEPDPLCLPTPELIQECELPTYGSKWDKSKYHRSLLYFTHCFPGWAFNCCCLLWQYSGVLFPIRLTLTVFFRFLSVFRGGWAPGVLYSAIFTDVTFNLYFLHENACLGVLLNQGIKGSSFFYITTVFHV